MTKWKSWLAITALSLSVIGCAPAADDARDTNYHGAGVTGYGNNLATDDNIGLTRNRADRGTPLANANVNDQGNFGTLFNHSIYKDGTTGMNRNGKKDYGYATYNKRDVTVQQNGTFHIDRDVLARAVGSVVSAIPGVDQSTVLVTDEDIFIGCPGVTDEDTLNRAKLSAWGMTPRWYDIYISGDENVIDQVNTLVNRTGSNTINNDQLEAVLKTRTKDMTGMNVTNNNQNIDDYNLNQTYPNTNSTHRMTNQ
ncbi:YhcN/YlaJ family sporulation lipoprotein [Ammoniphilus sp. CFH 90114]|uniref:YhcN/YlaJ family sporulation lipoprotein n=1 Tax=Ammoniphilus sp. CFH 90114 TaxID=2493665 RepID=UPI0013E9133F|nr:YhcN/YlaJ family sporulation lipoprotein [Ammoniphilus sp. CFH 90114]